MTARMGMNSYQLPFIVGLVILGNLWNNHVVAVVQNRRLGFEEDEGKGRRRPLCLLDCGNQL